MPLHCYLVGGAVRDHLLGVEAQDRDWVVVGSTPEEMKALGFEQVGADFPVFLHPHTKEEYALARQERKTSPGRHGFHVSFDANTRLEDDLRRRDLTINAMALDVDKNVLIDPWGGQVDLDNKILRHVSEAFSEDPLRILRLARFIAKTGFTCAPETRLLCEEMCRTKLLAEVAPERFYAEFEKMAPHAQFWQGLSFLSDCKALSWFDPGWPKRLKCLALNADVRLFESLPPDYKCALSLASDDPQQAETLARKLKFNNTITTLSKRIARGSQLLLTELSEAERFVQLIECAALHHHDERDDSQTHLQSFYECIVALAQAQCPAFAVPFNVDQLAGALRAVKATDVRLAVKENPRDPRAAAYQAKVSAVSTFLLERPHFSQEKLAFNLKM